MTELEWLLETHHPFHMVWELRSFSKVTRTKVGKRKLRLFACACCRLVWGLLTDARLRRAVEIAERFAEGEVSKTELEPAYQSIQQLAMGGYSRGEPGVRERTAARMALAAVATKAFTCAFDMTVFPVPLAGYTIGGQSSQEILCNTLRCIIGNPFRSVAVDRGWLAWNECRIPKLAHEIYDERRFEDLPKFADRLEEAGCTNPEILSHCRGPVHHARGCWVVDLVRSVD